MTFDPEGAAASYEIASRYAKPIEPLPQRSPYSAAVPAPRINLPSTSTGSLPRMNPASDKARSSLFSPPGVGAGGSRPTASPAFDAFRGPGSTAGSSGTGSLKGSSQKDLDRMGEDAAGAPRGKGSVSADFEGADWGDGGSGWADGEDEWG